MDFDERLWALASKVGNQREAIQTEEATKNAFIMPFISTILGYDIFNPLEVVPEFSADVGVKKNEKVDSLEEYAQDNVDEEKATFENVVGQDSLTRFDRPKKRRNKKRRKKPNPKASSNA